MYRRYALPKEPIAIPFSAGGRIKFFRSLKGMTQKFLGASVGFHEKTADIRIAQYESGSRTPKAELTEALATIPFHAFSIESCKSVAAAFSLIA